MALAIVSFSIQMFLFIVVEAITLSGDLLSPALAWLVVISMIACLVMSACSIRISSREKFEGQTGKGITGIVFGIIGTVLAAIFCTVFFVTLIVII